MTEVIPNNQVTKKEELLPTIDTSNMEIMGNEEVSSNDIQPPTIMLLQGQSKMLEGHQVGDIISSDDEVLAKKGGVVEVIPFLLRKSWQVYENEPERKWKRTEPWNDSNNDLPWEFQEDGISHQRTKVYTFYCLVLENGEINPLKLPHVVNFRSTSLRAGKKITSFFGIMKNMNLPGFAITWKIGAESQTKRDYKFQVFTVKKGRNTTPAEIKSVQKWLSIWKNLSVSENLLEKEMEAEKGNYTGDPMGNQRPQTVDDIPF